MHADLPRSAPETRIIQGRGTSLIALLVTTVLFALFAVFVLSNPENHGLNGIAIIIALVYFEVMMFIAWWYPPRLILSGDTFTFRVPSEGHTPLSNLADIGINAGTLFIRFHQLEAVETRNSNVRRSMLRLAAKTRNHLQVPGLRFSVDQVNEIRHRLGLPFQMVDDAGLTIADFLEHLAVVTPRPRMTYGLVSACVAVAAWMLIQSPDSFLEPQGDFLVKWGANYGPKTLRGEWWRIFSHQFVHVGVIHLLFNMWVLWQIGPLLERMVGSATFLAGYLVSGVAGGIASLWWNPTQVSAGASGALFGLIGILLGVLGRNRKSIPPELLRQEMRFAVMFVVVNVGMTISLKNVDNSAHLGGLAGGVLFGLLIQPVFTGQSGIRRAAQLAFATAGCFGLAAFLFQQLPLYADVRQPIHHAVDAEQDIAPRFYAIVKKLDADELTPQDAAKQIRDEVVTPWRQERQSFESLSNIREVDRPKYDAFLKYLQLREQSFEKYADSFEKNDRKGSREANQLTEKAFNTLKEWNESHPGQEQFSFKKLSSSGSDDTP